MRCKHNVTCCNRMNDTLAYYSTRPFTVALLHMYITLKSKDSRLFLLHGMTLVIDSLPELEVTSTHSCVAPCVR